MAIWLVKARPRKEKLAELRLRLDSGEIEEMRPFGTALDGGLRNARFNPEDHFAYWEEEDYCQPPLAQEREAILDDYFDDLIVLEDVKARGRAWKQIENLQLMWLGEAGK
jgi:hypothetical protein